MTEKIISEINLDLVFKFNEFPQFLNKLKDSKNKLIFESNFWEKVFLSWIKIILKKDDYKLPNFIFEKKSFFFKIVLSVIMLFKSISFMSENLTSNNIENDEFNLINEDSDYKDLIIRLNEIKSTIALLEKTIFK